MNRLQIIILVVVLLAGVGGYFLLDEPPPPVPVAAPAPPPSPNVPVLVTTRSLSYGAKITDRDMSWVDWPRESTPPGSIKKDERVNAIIEQIKASYVRQPFTAGDPIRLDHLVRGAAPGLLSTMLAPGKRAVAIDVTHSNTAGGFILPNDHVDVMRVFRDIEASKEQGRDIYSSDLVASNVRVMAIGQTIERKGDDPVASGATATLEVSPRQVELILNSQKSGQLTLVLRPLAESQEGVASAELEEIRPGLLTIVKRGVASPLRAK